MSWPYEDSEEAFVQSPAPTWRCPDEKCQCRKIEETEEQHEFSIMLLERNGERMPGARCRIHHQGRVINEDRPNADGEGWITAKVPRAPTTVLVEWAPKSTPKEPPYPYRAHYYVDIGESEEEAGRRRLHNLGFWTKRSLRENVAQFQETYAYPEITGELSDIKDDLERYHDKGCPPVTKDDPDAAPKGGSSAKEGEIPDLSKGLSQERSFAPGSTLAKLGDDKKDTGSGPSNQVTPQQPATPPGPNSGSSKAPPPSTLDLVVEWGERGKGGTLKSQSFWLRGPPIPVAVGTVSTKGSGWDTETPTALPVKTKTPTSVSVKVPVASGFLRLDFDLQVTLTSGPTGKTTSVTKTVLSFKQLYSLDASGALVDEAFSFADSMFVKGTPPATGTTTPPAGADTPGTDAPSPPARRGAVPVRTAGKSKLAAGGRRTGTGRHPLILRQTPSLISVNAEFVDATELWWAVHPQEKIDMYLDPALLGRTEHLRVLAWTGGTQAMIWFVIVPDKALDKVSADDSNVVFYRPPPEANTFDFEASAKGFMDKRHEDTTMWILARYLLRSQPLDDLLDLGVTEDTTLKVFSDQLIPWNMTVTGLKIVLPPAQPKPDDPMVQTKGLPDAFRPCWLEDAMNGAGKSHLLFLPLATHSGFGAAAGKGLRDTLTTAMHLLWNEGAIAREMTKVEDADERKIWLAGHSAGNGSMWAALTSNADDIDRILSFSATPKGTNLDLGIMHMTNVQARRKDKKALEVFVIAAPDMTGVYEHPKDATTGVTKVQGVSIDSATAKKLVRTGATVTLIPSYRDQRTYYTISPASEMNEFIPHLLGLWDDPLLEKSAQTPSKWNFLFFHEYPVYAGTGSTVPRRKPFTPPRSEGEYVTFKPLFLHALGAPVPLTLEEIKAVDDALAAAKAPPKP